MKYNAYLFDFDGTLADSMPSFISVMLRFLDENNIKYADDIIKIITPLGYAGTAAYFKKLGIRLSEEELLKLMNEYAYKEYAYNIQAKTNVVPVLEELKNRGADLNILTASPHRVLDVCLKRIGIYDLFTNVWSCDDFQTIKAVGMKVCGVFDATSKEYIQDIKAATDHYIYDFSELLELKKN